MDPFTQKILERSKARKEYLDAQFAKLPQPAPRKRRSPLKEENVSTKCNEIPENDKKNYDDSVGKRQCFEVENTSRPKIDSREKELKENVAAPKLTSQTRRCLIALAHLHSNPEECDDQEVKEELVAKSALHNQFSNVVDSDVKTPVPKHRINRLAALASNINKWEDDVTQKYSTTPSRVPAKTDSSSRHSSDRSPSSSNSSKTPPSHSSPSKRCNDATIGISPSRATPKLSLNKHKSPAKADPSCGKVGCSSSTSSSSSASSKRRSSSFSALSSPPANKRPSQKKSPLGTSPQSSKRVVWDQAIVATLQAQGFVQSPSKSKLEYKFTKSSTKPVDKPSKEAESEHETDTESSNDDDVTVPLPFQLHASLKTPPKTLEEPVKKSVKELARKFTGPPAKPVKISQRDPAELPLSARVALFEKEAANASSSKTNFVPKRIVSRMSFNEKQDIRDTPPVMNSPGSASSSPVKKSAKLSPSKKDNKSPAKKDDASVSPSKVGKHTFQLHRQLFEHVTDDWKENEISTKIREERQKDMEVVLNRWSHKSKQAAVAATTSVHRKGPIQAVSSTSFVAPKSMANKPKEQVPKSIPPPPPLPGQANVVIRTTSAVPATAGILIEDSFSDEEIDDALEEDSYESDLTDDITSDDSKPNEEDAQLAIQALDDAIPDVRLDDVSDTYDDDDEDDSAEMSPNETGLDSSILQAAFTKVSPLKKVEAKRQCTQLPYNPPAQQTPAAVHVPDNSQQQAKDVVRDVEAPLMHTVSFYRRQKETIRLTPVRTIVRHQELLSSPPEASNSMENNSGNYEQACTIQDKIKNLQEEVNREQTVISQTSQALSLCRSSSEFHGSAEQIEGERLLLIASLKLAAYLNEIKRLKTEAAIGADNAHTSSFSKGFLSISDIRLPLKKAFLEESNNGKIGDFVSFFLCLVKFRSLVIATQMVSTHDCISNGGFTLPNLINIKDLNRDFNVVVEVYGLQTKRENITKQQRTLANKKEKSRLALTPKKRQSKRDLRLASPAVHGKSSSSTVCTSSFDIIGFATINLKTLQRKSWVLEKCPHNSPLEGNILMKVQCHTEVKMSEEQGFLTMFEDVGGFGAWHRRWFNLSTRYMSYWKYPDDVKRKDPIGTIDLCKCITPEVGLVSRDICARPHTFMLLTVKSPSQNDENTLVSQSYSSYTVNKILLSADTKEERISWCQHLNRAIDNVRSWNPEALRPIPSDSTASK